MGKTYSNQEREEALKLAREIGTAAARQRLGINVDTDVHVAKQST